MIAKAVVLAVVVLGVAPGCDETEIAACPAGSIVIGAALDRTGTAATPSWASAIRLAEQQVNAALAQSGEFGDTRFCVRISDTRNDTAVGVRRAQELVAEGAKVVLSQQAPVSLEINKLNYDDEPGNDLGVPIICGNCVPPGFNNPNALNPDPVTQAALRDLNHWFFRTVMSNVHDAAILLDIATATNADVNGDGRFKAVVYTAADSSVESFRAAVKTQVTAVGTRLGISATTELSVQFPVTANPNTYDFAGDVSRLIDNGNEDPPASRDNPDRDGFPDVLIQLSPPNIEIATVKAYLAAESRIRFLHTINFRNSTVIAALGNLADGQEGVSSAVLAEGVSGQRFEADLVADTGAKAEIEDANYYDAAVLAMLAVLVASETASVDPAAVTGGQVRDALLELNQAGGQRIGTGASELGAAIGLVARGTPIDYDGASGPCDFTATGNVTQLAVHYRVMNKRYVDVGTWNCIGVADNMPCPRAQ